MSITTREVRQYFETEAGSYYRDPGYPWMREEVKSPSGEDSRVSDEVGALLDRAVRAEKMLDAIHGRISDYRREVSQ